MKTVLATAVITLLAASSVSASTVCFSPAAGCSLGVEQKIFVDKDRLGVLKGFGDIGGQGGPQANFESTTHFDFTEANGFANIKPAKPTTSFGDMSFFIPGHTFTDFSYDVQLAGPKKGSGFTIEAFDGKVLEGSQTYTKLNPNADLKFFLASTSPLTRLVWTASVGSGFEEMKHFQVSGVATNVAATPLPAALPMFGAGLGLLGLMGWKRRHRDSQEQQS